MTENAIVHSTFVIDRTYVAPPEKVFAAFADERIKRRWFAEGIGTQVDEFSTDFRIGGGERSRFRFTGGTPGAPPPGTRMGNDTTYLDIVPNRRIVFAYTMSVGDRRMSASLATVELVPSGSGTRLTFTEQAAFFDRSDGAELRQEGWRELLKKLEDAVS
jgi:uncharacterized protein YndB with AHSA1/START domain